jgi:hypothetical protein
MPVPVADARPPTQLLATPGGIAPVRSTRLRPGLRT